VQREREREREREKEREGERERELSSCKEKITRFRSHGKYNWPGNHSE